MKLFQILSVVLFLLSGSWAKAQLPDTEIFILEYELSEGSMKTGKPFNATERVGYDNQPSFIPNVNGFLYTSIRDEGNAEVYFRNLATGDDENLSRTDSSSEYSPQLAYLKNQITVVKVEDDKVTQRMWSIATEGDSTTHQLILEDVAPVGYYAWGDKRTLAMFILGEPNTLQIAYTDDSIRHLICGNIGRCIQKIPNKDAISYVHKLSDQRWLIKELDLDNLDSKTLIACPIGSEDYAWTKEGEILIGDNGKLMAFNPEQDQEWQLIQDFSGTELESFYRIAAHPDKMMIALVSYSGEKP